MIMMINHDSAQSISRCAGAGPFHINCIHHCTGTSDDSSASNVCSVSDAKKKKVPLRLLLATLLNVNRQLKRARSFLEFKILVTLIASPSSTCLISSCECQAASGGMLLVHSSPWKANLDCLHSLVFSASPFDSVAVQSVPSCSSFEIAP